ncbi:MAG: hypothetical protein QM756_18540 [Polyangiaceae bacterium]
MALIVACLANANVAGAETSAHARRAELQVSVTVVRACSIDTRRLETAPNDGERTDAERELSQSCSTDTATRVRFTPAPAKQTRTPSHVSIDF